MKNVATDTSTAVRIRMPGAPCCGRTLTLDHCGAGGPQGPTYDDHAVALAQRLHERQCTG